ncbi:P-loop containing nucleoside triphosphate hydrolase protein [Phellopilus nigrolimitatus]|nr:P-loop containing nucleoside triphosphate hydrolase protein [Phellopilus nigrolimitatus]
MLKFIRPNSHGPNTSTATDGSEFTSADTSSDEDSRPGTPVHYHPELLTPPAVAGVGLSDEHVSQLRRQMLSLVDRLNSLGIQSEIDLPQIVVIGGQSAGKSSLVEAISGIKLPRASGTCTRPSQLRLAIPITSPHEVEDRLRRAQRAILNPSNHSPSEFLGNASAVHEFDELSFSRNYISVEVYGPHVSDLSFVDLPGLIASAKYGKIDDVALIEDLLVSYMEKPSCLILLTVACETDFETQGAHQLAKKYDPEGIRTIGDEEHWTRLVKNEEEQLELGWFSVKQPNTIQLRQGLTWSQARDAEEEWFQSTVPWSVLPSRYSGNLGTNNLVERLSDTLSKLIARRLPELRKEVDDLLQQTEDELKELPVPLSDDALAEMMRMITSFCTEFLDGEEADKTVSALTMSMDMDDVLHLLKQSRTRELPDFYPFDVTKTIIEKSIRKWEGLVFVYFDGVHTIVHEHFKKLVDEYFKHFESGGLLNAVQMEVQNVIKGCRDETRNRLKWLLQLESRPFTLNEPYLADFKKKFLSFYEDHRYKALHPDAAMPFDAKPLWQK